MAPSWKMIAIGALVLAAIVIVYAVYESSNVPGPVTTAVPSGFSVNGKSYRFTYIATTQQEREKGLMGTKVTNATTELFAFPTFGNWQFWMYDTNTSLDMIWVSATGGSGKVVYLVTSAQPCYVGAECATYTPTAPANYVIEAKAGFAAANGITTGSIIQFNP